MNLRISILLVLAAMLCLWSEAVVSETIDQPGRAAGQVDEAACRALAHRFSDVVLLRGERIAQLAGESISGIRLMAWHNGRWEQVPFQLDEKREDGSYLFPLGEENDSDEMNRVVDGWDEVLFMASDAGCQVDPVGWPGGFAKAEEIRVTDPLNGNTGWFYLFSFPEPPPPSPVDLISYDHDYDRFTSKYYTAGYARAKYEQKAAMEFYSVPKAYGGSGENWFDSAKIWTRIKLFFSFMKLTIHSDDWVSWVPAYIDGPIRVIVKKRMNIKILGLRTPAVDADLAYYPYYFLSSIIIKLPFDPSIVTSSLRQTIGTDLDHNAVGMQFWNSENLEPVIVDGRMSPQEEAMDLSPDQWRIISGQQGKYLGKAVYAGNFKLSSIKVDEGRYIDDYTHIDPPENEPGIYGSYNWTWDITHGKKGKYVIWIEAHYGPPVEDEEDLRACLNVTDNPLHVRIGARERLNCLLVTPPGFTDDVLPEKYHKDVEPAE